MFPDSHGLKNHINLLYQNEPFSCLAGHCVSCVYWESKHTLLFLESLCNSGNWGRAKCCFHFGDIENIVISKTVVLERWLFHFDAARGNSLIYDLHSVYFLKSFKGSVQFLKILVQYMLS